MAIDTNYQMKQGESAVAYTARVDAYNASKHTGDAPAPTPAAPGVDANVSALQKMLMEKAGAVSSASSNIESAIQGAIGGVKSATQSESDRITSQFGRERSYAEDTAKSNFNNFSESRSGFGTQIAAFRELVKTTDKNLNDLSQRKAELLLQNDAAGASKIADLEMKALELRQTAAKDTFNNLLSTGAFALQVSAEQRAGREFVANFGLNTERLNLDKTIADRNNMAQMAELASQYGVAVAPGDTMADIATKVAPLASADHKAKLNNILAQTAEINSKFQKDKVMANFQTRVAELLASGKTQSEAVMQTMAEGKAIGLDITNELFNATTESAKQIADELKKQTDQNVSNSAPSYWENIFTGLNQSSYSELGASALGGPAVIGKAAIDGFEMWKKAIGF